jgi:hypothetical protein
MCTLRAILIVAAAAMAAAPATGQDQDGRYAIAPIPDGFLRLDSRTGQVSECRREAEGYRCRMVADERNALQAEIDRLERDNAALRERLARSGGAPQPPNRETGPGATSRSPSEAEVDRALGVMERFVRRFMSILREERGDPI